VELEAGMVWVIPSHPSVCSENWPISTICFLKLGDTTQSMSFRGGPFVLWAPSRKRVLLILLAILVRSTIVAAFFTLRGFQSHAICMNQSWICQIWGWFKNQNGPQVTKKTVIV